VENFDTAVLGAEFFSRFSIGGGVGDSLARAISSGGSIFVCGRRVIVVDLQALV
jgi:hypothetical protein